jgi:hypothetical protein
MTEVQWVLDGIPLAAKDLLHAAMEGHLLETARLVGTDEKAKRH